jgi:hypothetical protein
MANAADIAELRRLTDAPVMECRALLDEAGSVAAALTLWRERRGTPVTWIMDMGGHGPDHFMEITFDGDPRALVRAVDTAGYSRAEFDRHPFSEFRPRHAVQAMDLYVDDYHFDRLVANLRGTASTNLWTYQVMTAAPGILWIEHGYGSTGPAQLESEMRVIAAAAVGPVPRVRSWSIEYGGQGYSHGVVKAGGSASELRAYLGLG